MQSKKQNIVDGVTADIKAGILKPGQPLPTTPELVERYSASIATVRQAVAQLRTLGLVKFVPGVGLYVAEPER